MTERVSDISANLDSQLKKKSSRLLYFRLRSMKARTFRTLHNKPYLFGGVDETLSVTEEFLGLVQ